MNFYIIIGLIHLIVGTRICLGNNKRVERHLNGTLCTIEEYPCMVFVFRITSYLEYSYVPDSPAEWTYFAGTLITSQWFLTTLTKASQLTTSSKVLAGTGRVEDRQNYSVSDYKITVKEGRGSDQLRLCQFSPPFESSSRVQPVKLPPNKHFSHKCKNVTIVRWSEGSHELYIEGSNDTSKSLIKADAKIVKCLEKDRTVLDTVDGNNFCIQLVKPEEWLSNADRGLPVFCDTNILIGIIDDLYGERRDRLGKIAVAINTSQYNTWFNEITGVKVAYKSKPIYKRQATSSSESSRPTSDKSQRENSFEIVTYFIGGGLTLKASPTSIIILMFCLVIQRIMF